VNAIVGQVLKRAPQTFENTFACDSPNFKGLKFVLLHQRTFKLPSLSWQTLWMKLKTFQKTNQCESDGLIFFETE